jgi:hypothetical protein
VLLTIVACQSKYTERPAGCKLRDIYVAFVAGAAATRSQMPEF